MAFGVKETGECEVVLRRQARCSAKARGDCCISAYSTSLSAPTILHHEHMFAVGSDESGTVKTFNYP